MIPVIAKKSQSAGIISYNEEKVSRGEAERIHENFFAPDIESRIDHFDNVVSTNDRVKKNKFAHINISFPPEDNISDEKAINIIEEYLEKTNYKNVPFTIYRHDDTDYKHYHIVTSCVDYERAKISDKNDFYISMAVARELEKKFGLSITSYEKDNKQQSLREINASKYSILRALRSVGYQSLAKPLADDKRDNILNQKMDNTKIKKFLGNDLTKQLGEILEMNGLIEKSSKSKLIDLLDNGLSSTKNPAQYQSFLKDNGVYYRTLIDKIGNRFIKYGLKEDSFYITDRKLPERFRYSTISNKETKSYDEIKQRKFIRIIAIRTLNKSKNLQEYISKLSAYGIGVDLASNKSGIYGISYFSINDSDPKIFKGSDLDRKSLTWSKIDSKLITEISNDQLLPNINSFDRHRNNHAVKEKAIQSPKISQSLDTSYDQQQTEQQIKKRKKIDKDRER